MSSTIIYKRQALRLDPVLTGLAEAIFVVACIGGCNRSTTFRSNRRTGRSHEVLSRDWSVFAAGTSREVIRVAIGMGMDTYGGMVFVGRNRGHTTGSAFVASTRKALSEANTASEAAGTAVHGGGITLVFGERRPDYSFAPFDSDVKSVFSRADVRAAVACGELRRFIKIHGPDPYRATGLGPGH